MEKYVINTTALLHVNKGIIIQSPLPPPLILWFRYASCACCFAAWNNQFPIPLAKMCPVQCNFSYTLLRLSPQCLHFINPIAQENFERITFSWLIATVILNKIKLNGFGGSLLSELWLLLQGILTGDRKLYQKGRCLLNCIDTESGSKLTLGVS